MFVKQFWSFVALMVSLGSINVYAEINEEEKASIKSVMLPLTSACKEELGITKTQILDLVDSSHNADLEPCFVSCFFKKNGILTSDGMYKLHQVIEIAKPHIKNDEEMDKVKKIDVECAAVNDVEVKDGAKGCERAMLALICFQENNKELKIYM